MSANDELNAFKAEAESQQNTRGGNYPRFKPEFEKLYTNFALIEPPSQWEIPSKTNPSWQPSAALDIVDLETKERYVWWFTSVSATSEDGKTVLRRRWEDAIREAETQGIGFPMRFRFAQWKEQSTKSNYQWNNSRVKIMHHVPLEECGLHHKDKPQNDQSLQTPTFEAAKDVGEPSEKPAAQTQWTAIVHYLSELLKEWEPEDAVEYINNTLDIKVELNELVGNPPGANYVRFGYGTLSHQKATIIITSLDGMSG